MTQHATLAVVLALVCLVSAGMQAGAAPIDAQKDSFIQKGNATTNYGNAASLVIKGNNASTTRKVYMQFDISSIADPSSLIDAQLDLVGAQNSKGNNGTYPYTYVVEVYGLNDGVNETWVEGNGGTDNTPAGEITWSNAPANNNDNTFSGSATSLGSFTLYAVVDGDLVGDPFGLDSAALLTFINSDTDGLVTLMLRRTDGDGNCNLAFASKEHATLAGPQLTLTIPEPATIALAAMGLAALRRRRRA